MGYRVAVIGATGIVGREMVSILEERSFPVDDLRLFASGRSAGEKLTFRGTEVTVENLATADLGGLDVTLASAGSATSKDVRPRLARHDVVLIDNSSAFRMDPEVPLVVPEVNPEAIQGHKGVIANPNCSTIQLVVVLWPLHRAFGLRRVVVSTYQAVSGAGKAAIDELSRQCVAIFRERPLDIRCFPHQIAFNLIPHIGQFEENGYCVEETKVIRESRKIMEIPDLRITCTAVRVPVFNSHSESVNVEFAHGRAPRVEAVREVLERAPSVTVVDDPSESGYPFPLMATGRDDVLVGRIRADDSCEAGFNLWIVADNIRKGAALNAVQIAELLLT